MGRLPRQLWLSLALVFPETVLESILVSLLVLGHVTAALRVDTVREHIVSVDVAANYGVGVAHAIGMEGGLAEIGGESRVREPSSRAFEVLASRIDLHFVFGGLSPLLKSFFVDPNLPAVMILFMKKSGARRYFLWESILKRNHGSA